MELRSGYVIDTVLDMESTSQASSGDYQTPEPANVSDQYQMILDMLFQMQRSTQEANERIEKQNEKIEKQIEAVNLKTTEKIEKQIEMANSDTAKQIEAANVNTMIKIELATQDTNARIEANQQQLRDFGELVQAQVLGMERRVQEIERRTDERFVAIEEKIQEKIQETIDTLDNRILRVQNQVEARPIAPPAAERIQVVVTNAGGMESKERFNGTARLAPKTFLKTLEESINVELVGAELRKPIRSWLIGDAVLWFDLVAEDMETYEEFKAVFLRYFWGDQTQSSIRENLFCGRYSFKTGLSREKYIIKKFSIAKQLDPAIAESDIIRYLTRHFEEDIANAMILQDIRDLGGMLEFVKRIDEVRGVPQHNKNQEGGGRITPNKIGCEENKNQPPFEKKNGGRFNNNQNRDASNNNDGTDKKNNWYDQKKPKNGSGNTYQGKGDNARYTNSARAETSDKPKNEGRNRSPVSLEAEKNHKKRTQQQQQTRFDEIVEVYDEPREQDF